MTDDLNYDAFGDAVRERMKELHQSIRGASTFSHQIDTEVNGSRRPKPGLGDSTWGSLRKGEKVKRTAHTLHLVDQTLRWPEGTAHAILHDDRSALERLWGDGFVTSGSVADAPPADDPCPCARQRGTGRGTVEGLLHPDPAPTVTSIETDNRRDEVDLLRREVLRLGRDVEELKDGLKLVRRLIDQ